MREPNDQEDDIVLDAIIFCERDLFRTDIKLVRELHFMLQRFNFLLIQIDANNFKSILI